MNESATASNITKKKSWRFWHWLKKENLFWPSYGAIAGLLVGAGVELVLIAYFTSQHLPENYDAVIEWGVGCLSLGLIASIYLLGAIVGCLKDLLSAQKNKTNKDRFSTYENINS